MSLPNNSILPSAVCCADANLEACLKRGTWGLEGRSREKNAFAFDEVYANLFSQQVSQIFSCCCLSSDISCSSSSAMPFRNFVFRLRLVTDFSLAFYSLRIRDRDSIVSDVWRLGHTKLHFSWTSCALGTICNGSGAFSSHFAYRVPLCHEPHEGERLRTVYTCPVLGLIQVFGCPCPENLTLTYLPTT